MNLIKTVVDLLLQNFTLQTNVVCPVIDVIDDDTLEYHYRDSGGVNVGKISLWKYEVFVNKLICSRWV